VNRFLIISLFLVSACSSLSQRECLEGDWYNIGVRDGSNGEAAALFQKHTEACREYGVNPNRQTYDTGRVEGLKVFCTPENGFALGKRGRFYYDVCPPGLAGNFLRRYRLGYQMYEYDRRITRLYDDILDYQNQLDKDPDDYSRRRLREKISDSTRERDRLQRELTVIEIRGTAAGE
jgi:hypothetical protein